MAADHPVVSLAPVQRPGDFPRDLNLSEDVWAVLVAGEHWMTTTGERYKGLHCSLEWVGQAYTSLLTFMPPERIIVIAQVDEVREWLRSAVETGEPQWSARMSVDESKAAWAAHLAQVERSCANLMKHGCDYDHERVNPETLMQVLVGDERAGGKVVPEGRGRSVLLGIYSHGWSHESAMTPEEQQQLAARIVCDMCGKKHDPGTPVDHDHSHLWSREWYFHMPHAAPVDAQIFVGIAHAPHDHYRNLCYWQMLFGAFAHMLRAAPQRPIVALYNFCGSGGMVKFMKRESYRTYYKVDMWPLYQVASSGELDSAIPGLFECWYGSLARAMKKKERITLAQLYQRAEEAYLRDNPALIEQAFQLLNPCLLCREFNGREDILWMCTVCHKKYVAMAEEARPDLDQLRAEVEASKAAAAAAAKKNTGQFFEEVCGAAGLRDVTIPDLFGAARSAG